MSSKTSALKAKAVALFSMIKQYWHIPPEGYSVPYKEIFNLGIAGIGTYWARLLAVEIALSANTFLVGHTIKLDPMHLQYMLTVANIVGMPIAFFRGWYVDNHKMKGGKYLPFLIRTPFPIAAISTLFVWLPFDKMTYNTKAAVVWFFYMAVQFFICFLSESFSFVHQTVSSNAQERTNATSFAQIIYSFAPTLSGFLVPTVAGLTYGLNDIRSYRTIYPAFTILGLIISVVFYSRVKERIVLPKRKIESVRIIDSLREISKNKYFWIINGAEWIGFLEGGYGVLLGWTFMYAYGGEKQALLGTANTIIGNAALWSMLLAPLVIKKLGKRNLLILCNIINVFVLIALYFSYKNLLLMCAILYFNNFVNTFRNIYLPGINADMRDYHQWKTGVRADGMFVPAGLIGTFIGFFTGLVIPAIYKSHGYRDENAAILYDDTVRNNLFEVLIMLSVVGAILNLIPYLFYDLTEAKQRGYVCVNKIRVMIQNHSDGTLSKEQLKEGIEIIRWAREVKQRGLEKAVTRKDKKALDDEAVSASIVIDELEKFYSERYKKQLEYARHTVAQGPLCVYGDEISSAKALPKSTKQEKLIRKDAISLARKKAAAARIIKKIGADNLKEPNEAEFEELRQKQTTTFKEALVLRRDIRNYQKAASFYQRAIAPYKAATVLVLQADSYCAMDKFESLYEKEISSSDNV